MNKMKSGKYISRNWVEVNDLARGTYNTKNIKFKRTRLTSNGYLYFSYYIHVLSEPSL